MASHARFPELRPAPLGLDVGASDDVASGFVG